jgi:hypothetical protein
MATFPPRVQKVLSNEYDFQFGKYINDGFNIFSRNAGMFVGFALLYFAIALTFNNIKYLGSIASLFISPALSAGYFIVAHKVKTGEFVEFNNFFDGFKQWSQLFLAQILTSFIALIILTPFLVYLFMNIGFENLDINIEEGELPEFVTKDYILLFSTLILAILLGTIYIYTPIFVIFDKMDAWSAMEASRKLVMKNLLTHVGFLVTWGFIMLISALPLFLGLLATVPAFYASLYAAWSDITHFNNQSGEEDDFMQHLIE